MLFKLDDYKRELTDEEILSDIKAVALKLGKDYVSLSAYKTHGKYSQCAIQGHFETWKNALMLAGLRNERTSAELKRISDDDYFEDLRRVAKAIDSNTISYKEYDEYGKYSVTYIFKRFGKWSVVLEKAGLESTGFSKDKITEQQCFDEIERMWRLLGRQPTTTDIVKGGISKYSIDTFKRRFGGWRKALEAFVEYINDESNEETPPIDERVNDESRKNSKANELPETEPEKGFKKVSHRTSRGVNTRLRFLVMKRDNFKCCICGSSPAKDPVVELHVDHIVPWSKGGETVIENLQTLCSKCNLGKSDFEL